MQFIKLLFACILCVSSVCALAVDARDRGFISQGMAESEVFLKIGKPDYEALISDAKCQPEKKTWAYFPHARDPQTLTIITLRAGVVAKYRAKDRSLVHVRLAAPDLAHAAQL
jgi:hypothetical protein